MIVKTATRNPKTKEPESPMKIFALNKLYRKNAIRAPQMLMARMRNNGDSILKKK